MTAHKQLDHPLASLLWFYANNDTVVQSTPFTGQAAVLWVANAKLEQFAGDKWEAI